MKLKLKKELITLIKNVSENTYCLDGNCEECPLNVFDNEDMSCQEIAIELLEAANDGTC